MDRQLEDAWNLLNLINDWIKHAEQKLGVTLAFLGVIAVGFLTFTVGAADRDATTNVLLIIGGVVLAIAVMLATAGLLPRLGSRSGNRPPNIFFYRDIAERYEDAPSAFARDLGQVLQSPSSVLESISRQCVANSVVAVRKYRLTNCSIGLGTASFLLLLAAITVYIIVPNI